MKHAVQFIYLLLTTDPSPCMCRLLAFMLGLQQLESSSSGTRMAASWELTWLVMVIHLCRTPSSQTGASVPHGRASRSRHSLQERGHSALMQIHVITSKVARSKRQPSLCLFWWPLRCSTHWMPCQRMAAFWACRHGLIRGSFWPCPFLLGCISWSSMCLSLLKCLGLCPSVWTNGSWW